MNVRRLQKMLVLVASLMAGVTIAVSGTIGFVGLMVPHFTRLLVGGDHKKVLPISALFRWNLSCMGRRGSADADRAGGTAGGNPYGNHRRTGVYLAVKKKQYGKVLAK